MYGHILPAMYGKLIAYHLKKGVPNRVYTRFLKKFFGQETSSHGGKYKYRRQGLLDGIPYVKLIRGVLIVLKKDADLIIDFFQDFDIEYHVRKVELTADDLKILRKGEK